MTKNCHFSLLNFCFEIITKPSRIPIGIYDFLIASLANRFPNRIILYF